jgi:TIR domain
MGALRPIAFLSYSHVAACLGCEFPIFQDRSDIRWGQQWRQRIDESLDSVTFFIPILSPSFFASTECRYELGRFLDREQRLGRSDLILAIAAEAMEPAIPIMVAVSGVH